MKNIQIYHVSAPFVRVKTALSEYCKVTDETKRSIIEETAGTLSSNGVISLVTMTAGGLAIMADHHHCSLYRLW